MMTTILIVITFLQTSCPGIETGYDRKDATENIRLVVDPAGHKNECFRTASVSGFLY